MAHAAPDVPQYARANWQAIRTERERLSSELERRRLAVVPSQANFLLVTTPDAAHAGWLYAALKVRGVLVRFFDKPALDNKLRISVGAPDELSGVAGNCPADSTIDDGLTAYRGRDDSHSKPSWTIGAGTPCPPSYSR